MDPITGKRDAALHIDGDIGHDISKRARMEDHHPPIGSPEEIVVRNNVRRDRAIANYYRRLTINNDIQFYQDILVVENLGEAMKRNIKNKLNILLSKKMEDRYDDVSI